jgi:serine/threonine-protein kinase
MTVQSAEELCDALRGAQVLTTEQLRTVRNWSGQLDAMGLAKRIFKKRWLTRYQLTLIMQGRGDELTLGQYRIVERLGAGGMGQVFKATQIRMGRTVALKVLKPELVKNVTAVRRFQREVRAAALLDHPHIVKTFDADTDGETHFLAMEYVEGRDLRQIVLDKGALSVELAVEIIRQAALGLQHAHEKGMVHRDIKPGNILLTEIESKTGAKLPTVKLLDMGLARSNLTDDDTDHETSITQAGVIIGTPDYMAPEQAKNSRLVDYRADIYSLGCTLYYLLTASVPFPTGTTIEKLLKHQFDYPDPPEKFRSDVPDAVRSLLGQMMAKRPEDRPASADEVVKLLDAAASHQPVSQRMAALVPLAKPVVPTAASGSPFNFDDFDDEPSESLPPPPPRKALSFWQQWRLALVGAGTFLMFVLALALIGWGGRSKPPVPPTEPVVVPPIVPKSTEPIVPQADAPTKPLEFYLPDETTWLIVLNVRPVLAGLPKDSPLRKLNDPFSQVLSGMSLDVNTEADRIILAAVPAQEKFAFILEGRFRTIKLVAELDEQRRVFHKPVLPPRVQPNTSAYYFTEPGVGGVRRWLCVLNPNTIVIASDAETLFDIVRKEFSAKKTKLMDRNFADWLDDLRTDEPISMVFSARGLAWDRDTLENRGLSGMIGFARVTNGLEAELELFPHDDDLAKLKGFIGFLRFTLAFILPRNPQFAVLLELLSRMNSTDNKDKPSLQLSSQVPAKEFQAAVEKMLTPPAPPPRPKK